MTPTLTYTLYLISIVQYQIGQFNLGKVLAIGFKVTVQTRMLLLHMIRSNWENRFKSDRCLGRSIEIIIIQLNSCLLGAQGTRF